MSIELNIPDHILNYDDLSESQLKVSVAGSVGLQRETSINEDGDLETAVFDVNGGGSYGYRIVFIVFVIACITSPSG